MKYMGNSFQDILSIKGARFCLVVMLGPKAKSEGGDPSFPGFQGAQFSRYQFGYPDN